MPGIDVLEALFDLPNFGLESLLFLLGAEAADLPLLRVVARKPEVGGVILRECEHSLAFV